MMNTEYLHIIKSVLDKVAEKSGGCATNHGREVKKNGINIEEMNIKLLEKVEQLTLYTLQQEKRIKDLEEKVGKLNRGR